MRFRTLPQSEHPWVKLRPLCSGDLPAWSDYLNLPQVYEHTSWRHPTADELASYLGSESADDPSARLRLAIAVRDTDLLVGTIGFHSVSGVNRCAELAYDLHPSAWGKGIATGMVNTVVPWAHAQASVLRVQATVLASNVRSRQVLTRCNFVLEGLLRSYRLVRGTPGDFFMYARVVPPAG